MRNFKDIPKFAEPKQVDSVGDMGKAFCQWERRIVIQMPAYVCIPILYMSRQVEVHHTHTKCREIFKLIQKLANI